MLRSVYELDDSNEDVHGDDYNCHTILQSFVVVVVVLHSSRRFSASDGGIIVVNVMTNSTFKLEHLSFSSCEIVLYDPNNLQTDNCSKPINFSW